MKTRPIKSVQMKGTASFSHSKGKTVLVNGANQQELPAFNCGPFKQIPEYEPLHDISLSDYFCSKQKKLHLKKQGIIDKNNRILNNRVIKDNEIYEQRNMNRFIKENGIVPICEVPIVQGIKYQHKSMRMCTMVYKDCFKKPKNNEIKLKSVNIKHDKNTKTVEDPLNYQATFEEQLRVDNERVSGVKSVRQQRPKSARPTRNSNFPVATDFSEAGSIVGEKEDYSDEDFESLEKASENYVIGNPTK